MEAVHGDGEGRCLSGHTVERARSMPQEQAPVCPASTSTSFTGHRRMVIGSRCQLTCGQHRPWSLFEAANPFTFWVHATRFMWMPWLLTAQTMMLPAGQPRTLPSAVHPEQEAGKG